MVRKTIGAVVSSVAPRDPLEIQDSAPPGHYGQIPGASASWYGSSPGSVYRADF